MTATPSGWLLDGQDVFLCTPEQPAFFRSTATVMKRERFGLSPSTSGSRLMPWG